MVKKYLINIVLILLTTLLSLQVLSQTKADHPQFNMYRNWGIVVGSNIYNRATIRPFYGDYTFQNKPIPSYCFGFDYQYNQTHRWSFSTGLLFVKEPVYEVYYRIYKKDLYPEYIEDLENEDRMYAVFSFSTPLLINLNLIIGSNTYLNVSSGLKVMYFPPGEGDLIHRIHNADQSESREVFGLKLQSQDFLFYGSYVGGGGVTYATSWGLLKANLIYVINFQNTIEGEYQFANLLTSPPTKGKYELSGNYLGLIFSFNPKKKASIN